MIEEKEIKLVVLGDQSVGKTSIINRYVTKQFSQVDVTVMAGFIKKQVVFNDKMINLHIWDTAGQEKYRSLIPMYYKDAQVAILVYDVTNIKSFNYLKTWVQELKEQGPEDVLMVIVGNKIDLIKNNEENVSSEKAELFTKELNGIFMLISAKENYFVENLFEEIIKNVEKDNKNEKKSKIYGSKILNQNESTNNDKKTCCFY